MATTHIVRQGECLSSIAQQYGFTEWRTIYNHPNNTAFQQQRPNPNLIYPGDTIFIPDKEPSQVPGDTEQRHKFKRKGQETWLRLVLHDAAGQPIAGQPYRLEVGAETYEDTTGPDGLIAHAIPAQVQQGHLTVWQDGATSTSGYTWPLKIGHLDPVEKLTGVQARLNNLRFDCGPVDGINGPKTTAAVKAFQKHYGLIVDGIPGPKTQAKLQEVHGC